MRLGILGGSFDPPHVGHLTVARRCREVLGLDRVSLVPAWLPPHKLDRRLSAFALRLEMVQAATAGEPGLDVLTLEADRGGVSYTIDTLRELRRRFPEASLWLCMGEDSLREVAGWRAPAGLAALARFAVYRRPGPAAPVPPELEGRVDPVPGEPIEVSSTLVRERIARGLDAAELTPAGVLAIIAREGLYRGPDSAGGRP